jgi:hypothetical protein
VLGFPALRSGASELISLAMFKAIPFSAAKVVQTNSDIKSLQFDGCELIVVVGCDVKSSGIVEGIEVRFSDVAGLRYLDEVDLVRYWTSTEFPRGHYVIEVVEGGWSQEESDLQGYTSRRREWLIVTGNGCVSVFSINNPLISNVEYEVHG